MTRPLVLFHDSCPDGFASAWVAHLKFDDTADYLPVQYGQEPPDLALQGGRDLFILDFSYPRDTLLRLAQTNHAVTVLDHHRTAQANLAGLAAPGLSIMFDMSKSGGRLTWEHFFPGKTPPWIVGYVQDRDLWTWKLPDSKAVNAALASYPHDFETWTALALMAGNPPPHLIREGTAILRYQAQLVESHVANAVETVIDGHAVLSVNATCLMSEIGERLAAGRPFGMTWFQRADGKRVHSLRSREGGIDVSEVAKRHGGGGHAGAAGYAE